MQGFSVLISVYKNERPDFFNQAFHSIWDKQALRPDQIVLVQDGPLTPELEQVIAEWRLQLNSILTVVTLAENAGLGVALNEGLKHCRHDLVARMDTNDISLPDRFQKQIAFMEEHPDIAASSGTLEEWDETFSQCISRRVLPGDPEILYKFAKFRSPLTHAASVYHKSIVMAAGGYPPFYRSQDYALWALLLVQGYKLANIPDVIYRQRGGNELMGRRGIEHFKYELTVFRYQRDIHFLTTYEYVRNGIIHLILRTSPRFIRQMMYKYFRR